MQIHLSVSCDVGMNVSNRKWTTFVRTVDDPDDLREVGVCLAKTQLYNDFDDEELGQFAVTTEEVIWSGSVGTDQIIGMVMEFDTAYYDDGVMMVRTSGSPDATLMGSMSDPHSQFDTHVRGWWDHADVIIQCGEMNARREIPYGTTAAAFDRRVGCCEGGGPEELLFPEEHNLASPPGNRGLYGVNLIYEFTLLNSGNVANDVDCWVRVRNLNEPFFGAASVVEPSGYVKWGVPPLMPNVNGPHLVRPLVDSQSLQLAPISVPANETNLPFTVIVATGGACSTPFNIELYAARIVATPPEEGGDN